MPPFTADELARLTSYLLGEASPNEVTRIERWLADDPARAVLLGQLHAARALVHDDATADTHRFDARARDVGERVVSAILASDAPPVPVAGRRVHGDRPAMVRTRAWSRIMAWGAVAAVALIGVGLLVRHATQFTPSTSDAFNDVPARVYATATAQHAVITLDDGTRVTLAPQTTLRVPRTFGRSARDVALSGEAYFEVQSASRHPFIVRTGSVHTRVLGTAFDVQHYPGAHDIRVAVVQGRVAVASAARRGVSTTIPAGVVARVTDSTTITASATDMTPYTGWTRGQLDFIDAPLVDVLAQVGRWYGYRFELADSTLATKRLTATFDYASRVDVVKALEALLSVSITVDAHGADTVATLHRRTRATGPVPSRHAPFPLPSLAREIGR